MNYSLNDFCLFVAVSNSRGEFLLNGEFVVSMFKREIKVGNTVIEYSGSDHVIERINCTDRIEEEVIIQVRETCFDMQFCKVSDPETICQSTWFVTFYLIFYPFSQVLSVGNLYNPNVRYSFNIPIEDKPQQFFWDAYGPWQECSHLCQGEGEAHVVGRL